MNNGATHRRRRRLCGRAGPRPRRHPRWSRPARIAAVTYLKGGKIVRQLTYFTWAEALEAVGLAGTRFSAGLSGRSDPWRLSHWQGLSRFWPSDLLRCRTQGCVGIPPGARGVSPGAPLVLSAAPAPAGPTSISSGVVIRAARTETPWCAARTPSAAASWADAGPSPHSSTESACGRMGCAAPHPAVDFPATLARPGCARSQSMGVGCDESVQGSAGCGATGVCGIWGAGAVVRCVGGGGGDNQPDLLLHRRRADVHRARGCLQRPGPSRRRKRGSGQDWYDNPLSVAGGAAAQVSGDLSVRPGETLYVEVGGNGQNRASGGSGFPSGGDTAAATAVAAVVGVPRTCAHRREHQACSPATGFSWPPAVAAGERTVLGLASGGRRCRGPARTRTRRREGCREDGGGPATQSSGGAPVTNARCPGQEGQFGIGGDGGPSLAFNTATCRGHGGGGGGGYDGGGGGGGGYADAGGGGGGGSCLAPVGGTVELASLEAQPQVQIVARHGHRQHRGG